MPSYFFHVEFELYDCDLRLNPDSDSDSSLLAAASSQPSSSSSSIHIPRPETDIFRSRLPNTRDKSGNIESVDSQSHSHRDLKPENGDREKRHGIVIGTANGNGNGNAYESKNGGKGAKRVHEYAEASSRDTACGKAKKVRDWRFGKVSIESIDMKRASVIEGHAGGGGGGGKKEGERETGAARAGPATLGQFIPAQTATTDVGWGVVHLYRDAKETPALENTVTNSRHKDYNRNKAGSAQQDASFREKDCTTLCILAVPSYMTSSDLLGFVGERTREDVSHFRLIRTARANKYMVLMKFRDAGRARVWQREWNGKLFNSMEPENCHVVFVKSVQFRTSTSSSAEGSSFPEMNNDSFTPSTSQISSGAGQPVTEGSTRTSTALSTKPVAPPTRSLVELPTCPVCLERMDETTGLLTILCQHVFHCACLEKWHGSGCPVCRYTQSAGVSSLANNGTVINGTSSNDIDYADGNDSNELPENECRVCGALSNLWICLICGHTGCGRYDEAHAFAHYEATGHSYAMDIVTQAVWDYTGDGYVHRLIQNKSDGKLVDLPAAFSASSRGALPNNNNNNNNPNSAYNASNSTDSVPREKIDNMAAEYAYLLTSQLDSQRRYFEEQVERAVIKASTATTTAEKATSSLNALTDQVASLQARYDSAIASMNTLETSADRQTRRAEKAEQLARSLKREWQEEKTVNESLMGKLKFLEERLKDGEDEKKELKKKVGDLEEMNRDLGFFISGGERLKGLVAAAAAGESARGTTAEGTPDDDDNNNHDCDAETAGDGKARGESGIINEREIVEGRIELPPPAAAHTGTASSGAGGTGSGSGADAGTAGGSGGRRRNRGRKKK